MVSTKALILLVCYGFYCGVVLQVSTVVLIQIWLNVISAHTNPPTNHQPNNQSLFKRLQNIMKYTRSFTTLGTLLAYIHFKEFGSLKLQIGETLQLVERRRRRLRDFGKSHQQLFEEVESV